VHPVDEDSQELDDRARKVVDGHLVKQYIVAPMGISRFFVVGADKEYFVTRDSCSCESFQRAITTGKQQICKHIRALEITLQENTIEVFHISTEEYRELRPYLFGTKR